VGYNDTISDLALGGLGSLLAGLALTLWLHLRRSGNRRRTAMSDSR
jgi:hypothetical protein